MADVAQTLKDFGVFNGEIFHTSFHRLPTILSDARMMLLDRSEEEILAAATNIDWILENYIETIRENNLVAQEKFIYNVLEGGAGAALLSNCLGEEFWNADAIRELITNWPNGTNYSNPFKPEISIEKAEKTQKFDILQAALDEFIVSDDPNFKNGQHYEYFAMLSIYEACNANCLFTIAHRNSSTDLNEKELTNQKLSSLLIAKQRTMEFAVNAAFESMLALNFAKQIRYENWLEERYSNNIDRRVKTKISLQSSIAAKIKAEKSLTNLDKKEIKICWERWQFDPKKYKGKAAFSRDMLEKYEHVTSQPVIEEWCRDWEKEKSNY